MKISSVSFLFTLLSVFVVSSRSWACDMCAIYTSFETERVGADDLQAGLSEQFSYHGEIQRDGRHAANPAHEYLASSITQLFAAYGLSETAALQITVPIISRRYRRMEMADAAKGSEEGLGDISLLLNRTSHNVITKDMSVRLQLFAGLKLPTGEVNRLRPAPDSDAMQTRTTTHSHSGHQSAIHGHDLALGSGSVDVPLGLSALGRTGRAVLFADAQYYLCNEGAFEYTYADHFFWSAGPGYYLLLRDESALALRANLSGEAKGRDRAAGAPEESTGFRAVYGGPEVLLTLKDALALELGVDLPIEQHATGKQAVPDYRIRSAFSYRF